MSLLQYLTSYAEPECACPPPAREYSHVVVLPAFDEQPSMLQGLAPACHPENQPLWIVVVNASEDRNDSEIERSRYLLSALATGSQPLAYPGISLAKHSIGDIIVVDRVSPGRLLPPKEGVGLARKIGCDLALAWGQQGRIASPWIHCTDADVTLPSDYFAASDSFNDKDGVAALAYPFWHQTESASAAGRALVLYELSLRYYVLGLQWAGSSYAYHCIGSTMAVRSRAYLQVRGMPKRQAGEDFYLLNKVAKLGRVAMPACEPIRIAQRHSARTPFGTVPATEKISQDILSGVDFLVYNPKSFALVREWLQILDEFSEECDRSILDRISHEELRTALPLDTDKRLREAESQCKTPLARRARLHQWFDGFRTLKLIHALRDQGLADIPWREAFDAAPFVPQPASHSELRARMAERERERAPEAKSR